MCLFIFQCEKIRKKRSGMLGTIRIAQGNSIDDIDQRIMQARLVCPYIKNNLKKKTTTKIHQKHLQIIKLFSVKIEELT